MDAKRSLRKKILADTKRFHKAGGRETFVPGKTYVNYAGRVFDESELTNLIDASLDFWLTNGRYTAQFERKLADYIGVKYCILVNSGSSANLLAVSALTSPLLKDRKLCPGDEIITTACGFPTTLAPIIQNRLKPVFIDIGLGTYNIIAGRIEDAVSKKTKAIFVPHTLGNPADMDYIVRLAKKHKLWLLEDNCDALGSLYRGKHTGTFGDISTSSFYPPHHITMGEGGAVLTSDPLLRRILLSLRDWGRDCWCDSGRDDTCGRRFKQKFGHLPYGYDHKYVYSHIGYNLKATDLQAAIGVAQLKKLDDFTKMRKRNFTLLLKYMKRYERYFILPASTEGSDPSWFGFPILVKESAPFSREEIVNYLEDRKIATRMLFGGNLTKQPAYIGIEHRICGGLKNTDLVMNNLFWIGVYPGLTKAHLDYITGTFDSYLNRFGK